MEPYSIQVGNCYIDRFGTTYEVKAIEKETEITVLIYMPTGGGGTSTQHTTMPMTKFLEDLQGQVRCPGNNS